jgi:hypothetical protein
LYTFGAGNAEQFGIIPSFPRFAWNASQDAPRRGTVARTDARATNGRYFLATGGDISNTTTKLRTMITREKGKSDTIPSEDLPKFK